jgi:hypothetical protein
VRINSKVLTAAFAAGAVALLAGCAGGGSAGPTSTLPSSGMTTQSRGFQPDLVRSGVAPQFFSILHFGKSPGHSVKPAALPKDLFVDDFGTGAVEVLKNGTYANLGNITSGINGPDGNTVDKAGDLYVANYNGITIQEYAPGSSSPTFTYSSGMLDPVAAAVDSHGNVYEGDYNFGGSGFVNEYKQGTNTVMNTCSPGGAVEGVAIDAHNDVFADFNNPNTGKGAIVEYKHGLKGCKATTLGPSLSFAGGMVLDKNNNLVVCDQLGPTVDVIDPPYSSITGTLGTGYGDPFHVSINKKNKLAFVADLANANVQVLKYPSGTTVKTLNSANGLSDPAAAVDGVNAVY